MASKNNKTEQTSKADVILKREEQIISSQTELSQKVDQLLARPDSGKDEILQKISREFGYNGKQDSQMYESLKSEIASQSKEFSYVYTQIESAYTKLSGEIAQTVESISGKVDEVKENVDGIKSNVDEVGGKVAEASAKIDEASAKVDAKAEELGEKIDAISDRVAQQVTEQVAQENGLLTDDIMAKISAELAYMSSQITSVFDKLDKRFDARITALEEKIDALPKAVADEIESRAAVAAEEDAQDEQLEITEDYINYDELSARVAEKLEEVLRSPALDYDALAQNVADRIPPQEVISEEHIASRVAELIVFPEEAEPEEVNYEEIADIIAAKLADEFAEEPVDETEEEPEEEIEEEPEEEVLELADETEEETEEEEAQEIDYDLLADKIAERIPAPAVAEKEDAAEIDYDLIAQKIIEKLPVPAEEQPLDTAALAEDIAHKVNELSNSEYAIVVDDEGCRTLAGAVAQDIDYDMLADKVAEKLAASEEDQPETDDEELAAMIADRIRVADEDAIADKTAAAVSNYIPELDADEIAEKVANIIIPALPAAPEATVIDYDEVAGKIVSLIIPELPAAPEAPAEVNYDMLCDRLAVMISEAQSQLDYDIVLDGEGIHMLADAIVEELSVSNTAGFDGINAKLDTVTGMIEDQSAERDSKFDDVHDKLNSIIYKEDEASQKAEAVYIEASASKNGVQSVKEDTTQIISMLGEGALVVVKTEDDETAAADAELAEDVTEETSDETEEPVEEVTEEVIEEATEDVAEEVTEEPAEEPAEETAEEPAEEHFEDDDLLTVSDIVDDEVLDGDDSIAELIADEEAEGKGGVDFANMMKYNRSFIARIIQGSDDVKRYYGQIKNAMLSYKKVNSSIAWGAERFNKGRETIAKLKIRGKTLCLYLNLNPNDYKVSVYHHVDVTDNKSMSGTPMMVKVKSPLGVKKAIRLIDEMLAKRNGEKRVIEERDYASMYPYETIEELIEDGLVKDVRKNK